MEDRGEPPLRALDYPYDTPARSYVQVGECTLEPPADGVDLTRRRPLLAYGANASPLVLARKLAGLPPAPLPMMRARLAGFDVVYSAHVSPYGAVPATLHPSSGTEATVFVAYPDEAQLRALSATEPNYELTRLEGLACRLEDGRTLGELDAYLSRHGCLRIDGSPVALEAIEARGRRLAAMSEPRVLAYVEERGLFLDGREAAQRQAGDQAIGGDQDRQV